MATEEEWMLGLDKEEEPPCSVARKSIWRDMLPYWKRCIERLTALEKRIKKLEERD